MNTLSEPEAVIDSPYGISVRMKEKFLLYVMCALNWSSRSSSGCCTKLIYLRSNVKEKEKKLRISWLMIQGTLQSISFHFRFGSSFFCCLFAYSQFISWTAEYTEVHFIGVTQPRRQRQLQFNSIFLCLVRWRRRWRDEKEPSSYVPSLSTSSSTWIYNNFVWSLPLHFT